MRFRCVYKSDKETFKLVWAKHVWNLVCDLTWPFASLTLLLWGTYGSGVSWHVFIPLQYAAVFACPGAAEPPAQVSRLKSRAEAGKAAECITSLISRDKFLVVTSVSGRRWVGRWGGQKKVGKKPPFWHATCTSGPPSAPTCYMYLSVQSS